MDLSRWYNLRKQAQAAVRPVARAAQIERSTIPVTMEDEEGEFEAVVPVPEAIGSGVRAGAVADAALEHADQAAADALQAAQDAAAAQAKADAAVAATVVEYATSSGPDVVPSGGWSIVRPDWVDGTWIWSRTTTVFGSGSSETGAPVPLTGPAGEAGAPGSPGADGRGITDTEVRYQASSSGVVEPTGAWLVDVPTVPEGHFLWTRTILTYSDATSSTAFSVARIGEDGQPGEPGDDGAPGNDGVSVSTLTRFYWLGSSQPAVPTASPPPAPWMETEPAYTPGSSASLYEVTRTVMSDGTWSYGAVSVSAAFTAAQQAWNEANASKLLAEGLFQVIPSETAPTTSPTGALKQGDQWWKVGTGADAGKFIGVAVWNGTAWQDRQIVADSVLVPGSVGPVLIEDGAVTATKIAGDAIDGKTITGATVRTASSGQRMQLDADGLRAFDVTGSEVSRIESLGGRLHTRGVMRVVNHDETFGSLLSGGSFYAYSADENMRARIAPNQSQFYAVRPGENVASIGLYTPEHSESVTFRMSLEEHTGTGSGALLDDFSVSLNGDFTSSTGIDFKARGGYFDVRGNDVLRIRSRVTHDGNTFASKAALDAWSTAPDGTHAWVADEQREYVRVGSGWVPWYDGAGDTDWTGFTMSGWSTQQASPAQARVKGGVVYFRGVQSHATFDGGFTTVGTLPSNIPAPQGYAVATVTMNSTFETKMRVMEDRTIQVWRDGISGAWISLNPLFYAL